MQLNHISCAKKLYLNSDVFKIYMDKLKKFCLKLEKVKLDSKLLFLEKKLKQIDDYMQQFIYNSFKTKSNDLSFTHSVYPDLNQEYYDLFLEKIQILKDEDLHKNWFGFNINNDLAKLLYLANIPVEFLNYHQTQILTEKQKKKIILVLLKICKITKSKQVIYYLNKWATDPVKCKGFKEFERTFCQWFDFKNKIHKYKHVFTDACGYLMSILNTKALFMRNTNKLLNLKSHYNNETKQILRSEESRHEYQLSMNDRDSKSLIKKIEKKLEEIKNDDDANDEEEKNKNTIYPKIDIQLYPSESDDETYFDFL